MDKCINKVQNIQRENIRERMHCKLLFRPFGTHQYSVAASRKILTILSLKLNNLYEVVTLGIEFLKSSGN